jgi:hypothetical protein
MQLQILSSLHPKRGATLGGGQKTFLYRVCKRRADARSLPGRKCRNRRHSIIVRASHCRFRQPFFFFSQQQQQQKRMHVIERCALGGGCCEKPFERSETRMCNRTCTYSKEVATACRSCLIEAQRPAISHWIYFKAGRAAHLSLVVEQPHNKRTNNAARAKIYSTHLAGICSV